MLYDVRKGKWRTWVARWASLDLRAFQRSCSSQLRVRSRNLATSTTTNQRNSWMFPCFVTAQEWLHCVLGQFLSWTLTPGERRVRLRSTLPTISLDWDCPTNIQPKGCHILLRVSTLKVFLPEVQRVCDRAALWPTRFLWSVDERHPTTASSQLITKRNVRNWNQNRSKFKHC